MKQKMKHQKEAGVIQKLIRIIQYRDPNLDHQKTIALLIGTPKRIPQGLS